MGDSDSAARALAHMPRWVAVHENVLAMAETVIAMAGGALPIVDDILRDFDDARAERDRAIGVEMDHPTTEQPDGAHDEGDSDA